VEWLHLHSDFLLQNVPAGTSIGQDLDFFMLPSMSPDQRA
jgi:hypothetical protein